MYDVFDELDARERRLSREAAEADALWESITRDLDELMDKIREYANRANMSDEAVFDECEDYIRVNYLD